MKKHYILSCEKGEIEVSRETFLKYAKKPELKITGVTPTIWVIYCCSYDLSNELIKKFV